MAKSELKLLSDKSTKAREALAAAQKKLTEAEPTRLDIYMITVCVRERERETHV